MILNRIHGTQNLLSL